MENEASKKMEYKNLKNHPSIIDYKESKSISPQTFVAFVACYHGLFNICSLANTLYMKEDLQLSPSSL